MDAQTVKRSATQAGLISLPIGFVLVADTSRLGRLLGTGHYDTVLQVIGGLDLALISGLNLLIARYCVRLVRRDGGPGAGVGAAAMVAATIADGRAIAALSRRSAA